MAVKLTAIWLDHSRAIIVRLVDENMAMSEVASDLGRNRRSTGGVRAPWRFWHRTATSGKKLENQYNEKCQRFFAKIAERLEKGRNLWIFGPSTAKFGLRTHLIQCGFDASSIVGFETTNSRLTNAEVVALIKDRAGYVVPRALVR